MEIRSGAIYNVESCNRGQRCIFLQHGWCSLCRGVLKYMRTLAAQFPGTAACFLCVLFALCCQTATNTGAKYFPSPAVAVEQITVMLEEKNWGELAKYYDLTDSPVARSELISGEFFYTEEKPEAAHPAGFWKYKHPFAPTFKFKSIRELEETGVIEVTVEVEIDQGGGMIQRGLQTFLMRKSDRGYQVLPNVPIG